MSKRLATLAAVIALTATACGDGIAPPAAQEPTAEERAAVIAAERDVFTPQNDVEGDNYSRRQEIADDPTTILWCTSAFPIPSSPMFTVPIVGKLTSSNKRPFSTSVVEIVNGDPFGTVDHSYSPEVPGPDGFFGSSSEFRYGFTPEGAYVDFTGLETLCTTEPLVWQREQTDIALSIDEELASAQAAAQELLAAGDTEGAADILAEAIGDQ